MTTKGNQPVHKSNKNKPLPFGASHWDRLPDKLHDIIFEFSPLTQYINGLLTVDESNLWKNETAHEIWLEAFDIGWQGDLSTLPESTRIDEFLDNNDLCRVKSRSMYDRLCDMYPDFTESNSKFQHKDSAIMSIQVDSYSLAFLCADDRLPNLRLLHIPMHNMWLDVFMDSMQKYPYARVIDCIQYNHKDLLHHLIENRSVDMNQFFIQDYMPRKRSIHLITYRAYQFAAIQGHLDLFLEMHPNGEKLSAEVTTRVAGYGHLHVIKWLHEHEIGDFSNDAMDCAAEFGYFDVVKWLHENHTEGCTTAAMDLAAMNGRLDIVKFLHENRTEGCTTDAMDDAAGGGQLDVVRWLHGNRSEGCTVQAMNLASMNEHLDIVKWLHEHRSEGCTTKAMDSAAEHGHLDVIKWLHVNRSEGCTKWAMNLAAKNGHLHVIKWLHENRSEGCTMWAMNLAAESGHLHVVKWLHENRTEGCKDYAMNSAAENGYLDVVKFLHKNRKEGCTTWAMNWAARNGHYDVFKWLYYNRSEGCTEQALAGAAMCGHIEIVKFMCRKRLVTITPHCIKNSKTDEIADIMVAKLSNKQIEYFWRRFYRGSIHFGGYNAIKKRYDLLYE